LLLSMFGKPPPRYVLKCFFGAVRAKLPLFYPTGPRPCPPPLFSPSPPGFFRTRPLKLHYPAFQAVRLANSYGLAPLCRPPGLCTCEHPPRFWFFPSLPHHLDAKTCLGEGADAPPSPPVVPGLALFPALVPRVCLLFFDLFNCHGVDLPTLNLFKNSFFFIV